MPQKPERLGRELLEVTLASFCHMAYLGKIEESDLSFCNYNSTEPMQLDAKIPQFFSLCPVVLVHML